MPRLSKVDPCLICGEVPCECSAGTKKATGRRVRAAEPEAVVPVSVPVPTPPRPSMRDKMKAAAAAAPPRAISAGAVPAREQSPQLPPDPDPNLVLASALRALEPILHPEEKEKYRALLGSGPTNAERAAFWRARAQDSD